MAKKLKRVSYVKTSSKAVKITPTSIRLTYGGSPFPDSGSWSMSTAAFKGLRAENRGVKFVETKSARKSK